MFMYMYVCMYVCMYNTYVYMLSTKTCTYLNAKFIWHHLESKFTIKVNIILSTCNTCNIRLTYVFSFEARKNNSSTWVKLLEPYRCILTKEVSYFGGIHFFNYNPIVMYTSKIYIHTYICNWSGQLCLMKVRQCVSRGNQTLVARCVGAGGQLARLSLVAS